MIRRYFLRRKGTRRLGCDPRPDRSALIPVRRKTYPAGIGGQVGSGQVISVAFAGSAYAFLTGWWLLM